MGPLFLVWVLCAGIVTDQSYGDLQAEYKSVRLFEQTDYAYRTYYVQVKNVDPN